MEQDQQQAVNQEPQSSPYCMSEFSEQDEYDEEYYNYHNQGLNKNTSSANLYRNDEQSMPSKECRICFSPKDTLIQPCNCKGSMAYVHPHCLKRWLQSKNTMQCELCYFYIQQKMILRKFSKIAWDLIKLKLKLKLICYEMTFTSKQDINYSERPLV
eukprot:403335720